MADLDLTISGSGDAIGELLTYKPLEVLQRTEFKPEDFNGKIVAKVDARIGLIKDQQPPRRSGRRSSISTMSIC